MHDNEGDYIIAYYDDVMNTYHFSHPFRWSGNNTHLTQIDSILVQEHNKVVTTYKETGSGYDRIKIKMIELGALNLTSGTFLGFNSGGTVPDGALATIDIKGNINANQSGLTASEPHYVQTDGTLSTQESTPSVLAGTALSATEILVKG